MPSLRTVRGAAITPSRLLSLFRSRWTGVLLCSAAGWISGCGPQEAAPAAPAKAGAPAPEVAVVIATPTSVGVTTQLPGRLEAARSAEIRARNAGILQKRLFTEGSDVKAGQVLFRIDPAPYQASLQTARAALERAQAAQAQAQARVERYQPLVAAHAISQQEFTDAQATLRLAQADVSAARAALRTAEIQLGYTTVTAPISGRIGRSLVTEGALVGQGEATHLATIQQTHPLYINITQSAAEAMRLRQQIASGQWLRDGKAARVKVMLDDGSAYAHEGRLLFSDLSVDPATGQVALRAEIPNPEGTLLPGLYVRVQLQQAQAQGAMLIPQQAVTRGSQGDSVMVVGSDGSVAPRQVTIAGAHEQAWIVTQGLQAGEQVMVEGAMKLMRGAKVVKPVPWQPRPASPAPMAPASAASH